MTIERLDHFKSIAVGVLMVVAIAAIGRQEQQQRQAEQINVTPTLALVDHSPPAYSEHLTQMISE